MYERVTDAYVADPAVRKFFEAVQPVGAAVDRRAAAGGGRPGPVGRRRRPPWRPCGRAVLEGRGLGGVAVSGTGAAPASPPQLPLSAVVGQDDAKLALLLLGRRPGGSGASCCGARRAAAKSTLARGLAALLPGSAPFVELPLGATEDRVVGTLDLAAALTGGERALPPRPARGRRRRSALRRRDQPAARSPGRRAARRRRQRRSTGSSGRASPTSTPAASC